MLKTITKANAIVKTAKLTLRLDEVLKDRLQSLAKRQERSASYIAENAIEDYISFQEAQIRGIEKAIASADRGELIPHDKVKAWVESLSTKNPLPKPTV